MRGVMLVLAAFFLGGCFNSHTEEGGLTDGHANIRLAQTHTQLTASSIYNLEKVLQSHRTLIQEEIRTKAQEADFNATASEIELMTQAVMKIARGYLQKRFKEVHTDLLTEHYKAQVESLDAFQPDNRSDTLDKSEIENINAQMEDFFSAHQESIADVCQESIHRAVDEIVQRSYTNAGAAEEGETSGDLFAKNREKATFYNNMKRLYSDFNTSRDEKESGRYKNTPAGRSLYEKIPVTNIFDGETLRVNRPTYDTGSLSIKSETCSVDFSVIREYRPDTDPVNYQAVEIDREGDGNFSLLVFKRYDENGRKFYFPFLIENDYCKTKKMRKYKDFFQEVQEKYITDVVTGNFDEDAGMEVVIAVAGNSENEGNRFFVYDDYTNDFQLITDFKFSSVALEHAIVRLASGDSNGDGFDEIAAVSYDAREKSWNAQLFVWEPKDINYSFSPDNATINYVFGHKTPVDIVYADLNEVDHIELFAVQVDSHMDQETKAGDYYQPDQYHHSDDYCQFFATSTNYLDVIHFGYDFKNSQYSTESKQIKIINRTFDKQYNMGSGDDGVKCTPFGGCWCDGDFRAKAYHLYTPYTITDTDTKQWKPIYITPVHQSEDAVSLLNIDGFTYNYHTANDLEVYTPATNYSFTVKHGDYHYVPVRSNCSDNNDKCSETRSYVTHMIEGSRLYTRSRYTRSMPGAENQGTRKEEKISRIYDDDLGIIRRTATFPYVTRVLSYQFHDILYSKEPTIEYIIAPPPALAGGTAFELEFESCSEHERLTKKWHGSYFGISAMAGWKADGAGAETAILGGASFNTTQSSGAIYGHKSEKCLSRTMKVTNRSSDAIIHFRTNLIDVYAYKIIKDLDTTQNDVGKMVYINVARNPNNPEYKEYKETWELEAFEQTAKEYNISLGFDANLSKLVQHQPHSILAQESFYSILRDPSATLSDEFEYLLFWYPDENLQIPKSESEASLKFSEGYSKTNGTHDEDDYEAGIKLKTAFSWGAAIEIDAEVGYRWGAKHEDIYNDTKTTSFKLSVEGAVNAVDKSIGVFSYHVLPNDMSNNCKIKDEIPIDRSVAYDPNRKVDCKEAIMVVNFFASDDPKNKSPGEIQ